MESITSPSMAQFGARTSFFSPLIISTLGIVVTAMAIMAYHFILVKYCIRRYATAAAAEQPVAVPQRSSGVDEKVLQTIPILVFSSVKRGIEQGECVVCLGELEDEDTVRLLPNCNHAFHVSCIDQWFTAHASCPMCRSPLRKHETIHPAPESPDTDAAEDRNHGGSSESHATSPPRSLPRCASLDTPVPTAMERRSWPRLKRSLSMDQSLAVVIDRQRANCGSATSFASASRGILRSGSLRHFDHVPSTCLRSFPWWPMGKGKPSAILPY